MIPPPPSDLLDKNASFAKLHKNLLENKLDIDASTQQINASYQATVDELRDERVKLAKDRILLSTLLDIASEETLPPELRDLVFVVTNYISEAHLFSHDDQDLMKNDVSLFQENLQTVSQTVASSLLHQHDHLASVAAVASPDQQLSSRIPTRGRSNAKARRVTENDIQDLLLAQIAQLQMHREKGVPSALVATANALTTSLQLHATHIQSLIHHLEQRRYGVDSRHLLSQAHFLATVAQGLEAKTQVEYLEQKRDLYGPELRARLEESLNSLNQGDRDLTARRKRLEEALREYDDTGGDIIGQLGKRYGEVEAEIESVKRDVEQLQSRK